MGKIIAIEGVDGAGKFTISKALKTLADAHGKVANIISFPRYSETIAGRALGDFLSGRTYVPDDARSIATLYAMDRFESKALIASSLSNSDLLIFDRYIASNVAYQASKVEPGRATEMIQWISNLELNVYELPAPNLNVYLRISSEASARNVLKKPRRAYTELEADRHEADNSLLSRVSIMYEKLAAESILGNWFTVDVDFGSSLRSPEEIAVEIWSNI
ncbi:hypothetical protein [Mesorhizobium sp. CA12]|uniref:hypothetical protein n=1 Tax=Mesorhizobium sp. CA12 TaxID=2876644 RepID=UPI001CD027C3|nr:hypothetical protein [Mesorhizobium sp. CA12]MBZ9858872.1 hypothetical protein [Mesorhizobium sp. CA12]